MTDDMFFDTDCLSAFLWINDTNILQTLYGGKIILPEPVYQELSNPSIPHIKKRTDNFINNNIAKVQQIHVGTEEYDLKHTDTGHILVDALEKNAGQKQKASRDYFFRISWKK